VSFSLGLVAHEGRRDELLKTFRALLGSIRGSTGCLRSDLLEDIQQPNEMRLLVQWRRHEDLERHVKSDAFRRILVGMELSAEPPDLRIETIAGIRGMDLLREILECEDDRPEDLEEQRPAE
jgi:quinol monooxygenase YgiN